jgi:hypothetical protein
MDTRKFLVAGVASLGALRAAAVASYLNDDAEAVDVTPGSLEAAAAHGNTASEPAPAPRSRQVRRAEERALAKRFGVC